LLFNLFLAVLLFCPFGELMNQIYQATLKLLESDPDTRGFQNILEEGLSRLGKTPTDASGREIEKALKSNVYRQLQVSLPANTAKEKIQSILAKVALMDAPASVSQAANAQAELIRQAALIVPLDAGQKRFTLYFEWSEVQKFRSQLKVIQEQQAAGHLIPDLLRDATRQLELLEEKLQDSLVRQGQDINELLAGFERVKSMGGPRVKRLESLIGQISEAQSSQSLAPAEVERARKLVVELRRLVESSVVAVSVPPIEAEEDSIVIEEPVVAPVPSATGEILQIESADDDDLDISFDFTELEPEASARMQELDLAEERRKLENLGRDYRAVLEASADASVALSELRERNNNNELIKEDFEHLKATLETRHSEELVRQRERVAQLPEALERFAASGLDVKEARLTLSVAEGMIGSNVLAADEISKLEDLIRTFERQFSERERARLEEQNRVERALTRQTATLNQMREVVLSFMPLGLEAIGGFNNRLAELERDTQARVVREDITKALSDEMLSLQQSLEAFEAQKRLEAEQKAEAERKALEVKLETERKALEEKIRLERAEAERKAAEAAAKEAAERLEAERKAAEAVARLEAERLETAKRLATERLEAERHELTAKLEAERIAAAKLEAERVAAAKLEAERLEAERIAAEKAAREASERLEAERREAQARAEAEAREASAKAEAERLEGIRKAQISRETGALRTLRFSLAALPDLAEISASIEALEASFETASKKIETGEFITSELETFKTSLNEIGQEATKVFINKLQNLEERAQKIKASELLLDIHEAREALKQGEHPDLNQLEASLRAQREARLNAQRRELSELESAVREYAAIPEASGLLSEITNARESHEAGKLLDLASAWDKLEDLRLNEESALNHWRSRTDALVEEANGYKGMGGETIRQLSRLSDALAAERNMSRISPETRTRLEKNLEEAEELILHARQEYAAASAVAAALADSSQIDDLLGVFSMKPVVSVKTLEPVQTPEPEPVLVQTPSIQENNALHQWLSDISRERGIGQTGIIRSDGTLEAGNVARASELGHLLAETERYNLDLSSELRRKPARLHTIEYQGGALIAMFMRKNEAEASAQSTIVIQLEDMASYSRIFAQAQRDYDQLLEWVFAV
jgi:chromosome segregation protein